MKHKFDTPLCEYFSMIVGYTEVGDDLVITENIAGLEAESEALLKDIQAWRRVRGELEADNEALRKLAHDYITAYEKLAFGDALLTGEDR